MLGSTRADFFEFVKAIGNIYIIFIIILIYNININYYIDIFIIYR